MSAVTSVAGVKFERYAASVMYASWCFMGAALFDSPTHVQRAGWVAIYVALRSTLPTPCTPPVPQCPCQKCTLWRVFGQGGIALSLI